MRTLWHLGVALGFITAYVTSDAASFGDLHVWIGYGILAALGIRLIMGLTGGRFAFTVLRAKRPRWAWIGPVLGMLVVAAIVSGFPAEGNGATEHRHALWSQAALAAAVSHGTVMLFVIGG